MDSVAPWSLKTPSIWRNASLGTWVIIVWWDCRFLRNLRRLKIWSRDWLAKVIPRTCVVVGREGTDLCEDHNVNGYRIRRVGEVVREQGLREEEICLPLNAFDVLRTYLVHLVVISLPLKVRRKPYFGYSFFHEDLLMQVEGKKEWKATNNGRWKARKSSERQERWERVREIAKMSFFWDLCIHVTQKELGSSVKTWWRNQKGLEKSLIHSWIHTAAQSCANRRHSPENRKISPTQHFSLIKHDMISFSNG